MFNSYFLSEKSFHYFGSLLHYINTEQNLSFALILYISIASEASLLCPEFRNSTPKYVVSLGTYISCTISQFINQSNSLPNVGIFPHR